MKAKSSAVMILLVLSVFTFVIAHSNASVSQIKGTVYWFDQYGNLRPLPWAEVTAVGEGYPPSVASSTTDGTYMMWVAPGTYNISVSVSAGFTPESKMISVFPGSASVVDFELQPSGEPIPEYPPQLQPFMLLVAVIASGILLRQRRHAPHRST